MILHALSITVIFLLFDSFFSSASAAPRIEKFHDDHAVVCDESSRTDCLCDKPPEVGCDCCCSVLDGVEISCNPVCASGRAKNALSAILCKEAAIKVVQAFQQKEEEENKRSLPTTPPLPVTMVEAGGKRTTKLTIILWSCVFALFRLNRRRSRRTRNGINDKTARENRNAHWVHDARRGSESWKGEDWNVSLTVLLRRV